MPSDDHQQQHDVAGSTMATARDRGDRRGNGKGKGKGRKEQAPKKASKREAKRTAEDAEIVTLAASTKSPTAIIETPDLRFFKQLPLSSKSLQGLTKANFVEMTEIQKGSLPFTLCGRDVLGAAKTGSGKTLAFIVPVLEILHRASWSQMDGLGALIISPTRELALQIFEVLRKAGRYHTFSAGLLIGGKDLKQEQDRVTRMNILVCTPGRLLQHMDQTPEFLCDNLQVLVLDEADRILDSGFERTLNAIIANLPKSRQTLLFSATQTKSVRDLARLSLSNPEYISVHESASQATPKNLTQSYVQVALPQKLDVLFSFLKTHVKQKVLVFLSSCKQVRFVFETFCKMQPGIPLMCLHGKQKQPKRMAIFEQFCRKQSACLFATDIAARGLDFPSVDWVIQVDCPEDAATYIHRVGRTARYESVGQALLFLLPSEVKGMLAALEAKKVPIQELKINPSKTVSIRGQLASLCSQAPDLKYLGQKAFICYMRSVYLQSNKEIFDVFALPAEDFAESLGLPGAPRIKFIKKTATKNASRQSLAIQNAKDDEEDEASLSLAPAGSAAAKAIERDSKAKAKANADAAAAKASAAADSDGEDNDGDEDGAAAQDKPKKPKTKIDKMFEKKNLTVLSEHYAKLKDMSDSDEDEFLSLKRANHDIIDDEMPASAMSDLTHRQLLKAKKKELKARGLGKRMIFDEDGNAVLAYKMETLDEFNKSQDIDERRQTFLDETAAKMRSADAVDRAAARERLREKKRARKLKEKNERREESGPVDGSGGVTLGSGDYDSEDDDDEDDGDDNGFDEDSGSGSDEYDSEDDGEGDANSDIDMDEDNQPVAAPASRATKTAGKTTAKRSAATRDTESDTDMAGAPSARQPDDEQERALKRPKKMLKNLNTASLEDLALQLLGN